MKAIRSETPDPLLLLRGKICGMGLEACCDLLLNEEPAFSPVPEWTILRAAVDLPDGEYAIIASDGRHYRATRVDGFWRHHDAEAFRAPKHRSLQLRARLKLRHFARHLSRLNERHAISLMLFAALITYALPTTVELVAAHDPGFGLGVVVFGDLTGCACLAALLGMPAFGVVLYLLLSLSEACLYFTGILSASTLAWFADILPTLVVTGRIIRMQAVHLPTTDS